METKDGHGLFKLAMSKNYIIEHATYDIYNLKILPPLETAYT